MKYIIQCYKGRQSGTIRLLSFFFIGYRWSEQRQGSYFRIFIQIHKYQLGLQLVTIGA